VVLLEVLELVQQGPMAFKLGRVALAELEPALDVVTEPIPQLCRRRFSCGGQRSDLAVPAALGDRQLPPLTTRRARRRAAWLTRFLASAARLTLRGPLDTRF
jgi:hypothetical protein